MRCTVFGTGYLGATHAAGMAELGHDVVGVDIDAGKVAKLAGGDIPFYEPGLRKVLTDNLAAGRLRFTTDYEMAADFADVHFLGVGTPQKKGEYGADLRHVHAVIDTLVPRPTWPSGPPRWRPLGSTSKSLGIQSFCVRATPCRTPCIRTALSLGYNKIRCAPRRRSVSCTGRCWTAGCRSW
jgi:hypothetical protein